MKQKIRSNVLISLILLASTVAAAAPIRDFSLVNQDGKAIQLHDYKDRYLFLTFIFSRCPMHNQCPLTVKMSKEVIALWKKSGSKKVLHVMAVTLDPKNDTPTALKAFGTSHGIDPQYFTLATGKAEDLELLAAEFNVIGFPVNGTISHNMKNILLGPGLTPIKEYKDNDWKPAEVIKDLNQNPKTT